MKKINNTNQNTRLRKKQKENLIKQLIEQYNLLVKKEEFMHVNYDDLQYEGKTDIKNTYNYIDINNYYNPELIAGSFEENYKIYRINGDENKNYYLMIILIL